MLRGSVPILDATLGKALQKLSRLNLVDSARESWSGGDWGRTGDVQLAIWRTAAAPLLANHSP